MTTAKRGKEEIKYEMRVETAKMRKGWPIEEQEEKLQKLTKELKETN